jgi:hypothetical protein
MRLIFAILTTFYLTMPSYAGVMMLGGGNTPAGGGCTSGVADVTQAVNDADFGGATVMGQGFTPSTNTTIYSFVFNGGAGTSATLTCRLGAGTNLSSTYLEQVTGVTFAVGSNTVLFPAHSALNSSTLYSVICLVTAGDWNPSYSSTDVYGTGNDDYGQLLGSAWDDVAPYVGRDLTFTFNRCN